MTTTRTSGFYFLEDGLDAHLAEGWMIQVKSIHESAFLIGFYPPGEIDKHCMIDDDNKFLLTIREQDVFHVIRLIAILHNLFPIEENFLPDSWPESIKFKTFRLVKLRN